MEKEYLIGGKKFIQRPLVLGQLRQIIDLVSTLKIPEKIDARGIVAIMARDGILPTALAILLREPEKNLKEKNIEALSEYMEENADYLTTLEVVENFFDLTKPDLVFEKLAGLAKLIKNKMTGSEISSASSPPATSQRETKSSGDTGSANANPT